MQCPVEIALDRISIGGVFAREQEETTRLSEAATQNNDALSTMDGAHTPLCISCSAAQDAVAYPGCNAPHTRSRTDRPCD